MLAEYHINQPLQLNYEKKIWVLTESILFQ